MRDYLFSLIVDGVDVSDNATVDVLAEVEEVVLLSAIDGTTQIAIQITAATPEAAVRTAVHLVETTVAGAVVRQIDLDLVAAADIAERVEVSRQAVTNWAGGKVAGSAFPAPLGHVAGGTRVWAWSAVLPWLIERGHADSTETTLPYDLIVAANGLLQAGQQPGRHAFAGSWERPVLQVSARPKVSVSSRTSPATGVRKVHLSGEAALRGDAALAA